MKKLILTLLLHAGCLTAFATNSGLNEVRRKILIVVTNHSADKNGEPRFGFHMSEVTEAYFEFRRHGFAVELASPQGGIIPIEPASFDLTIPANEMFWKDPKLHQLLMTTTALGKVEAQKYAAIYLAGGHGSMWDFPKNEKLLSLLSETYETGGIVGAVCHGPSGLVNVQLSNGNYLVEQKNLTSLSNAEEAIDGSEAQMPFLLQTELEHHGAHFLATKPFQPLVVVSDRLVTGQNPASVIGVVDSIVGLLHQ